MRSARPLAWIPLIIVALGVAGCVRSDVDLVLHEDGTVDGTVVVAVREELVEVSGRDLDEFVAGLITRDGGPPDGSLGLPLRQSAGERYQQDGYVGARYRFDAVDAADFGQPDSTRPLFNQREDGSWRFEAKLLTDQAVGDLDDLGGLDVDATLQVQVAFPLAVRTHNGELAQDRNNVVRWDVDLTEAPRTLSATTSTKPAARVDDPGFPWPAVLIGAAALALVGALGTLWLRQRAGRRDGGGPETASGAEVGAESGGEPAAEPEAEPRTEPGTEPVGPRVGQRGAPPPPPFPGSDGPS
jgi:hypothetical protein